jgi:hypothetical protein
MSNKKDVVKTTANVQPFFLEDSHFSNNFLATTLEETGLFKRVPRAKREEQSTLIFCSLNHENGFYGFVIDENNNTERFTFTSGSPTKESSKIVSFVQEMIVSERFMKTLFPSPGTVNK